jgi:hypothetical protein
MQQKTETRPSWRNLNAIWAIVSTVGILCGISGIEHGFFETLQGNTAPSQLLISAIGPANRFWPGGKETALTIVPSFFITGLLAMLAGGGFAQIFIVLMTTAAATQINALGRVGKNSNA